MDSKGFTLLEVLVAMSIFAIIGLGASQMLQSVMKTHEKTRDLSEEFVHLTRGFDRIQRDVMQVVPRSVRDEYGEPLPPLMVGSGRYRLEMTRSGWSNPLGRQRSELQRVAYDLVDGELLRRFWLVLDRAEDSRPMTQTLMDDVEDLRINLLMEGGEQTDMWPGLDLELALPAAVEIIVVSRRLGEIRRVITLPANVVLAWPEVQGGEAGFDQEVEVADETQDGDDA